MIGRKALVASGLDLACSLVQMTSSGQPSLNPSTARLAILAAWKDRCGARQSSSPDLCPGRCSCCPGWGPAWLFSKHSRGVTLRCRRGGDPLVTRTWDQPHLPSPPHPLVLTGLLTRYFLCLVPGSPSLQPPPCTLQDPDPGSLLREALPDFRAVTLTPSCHTPCHVTGEDRVCRR